jgi:L-ascorbate metabolism protein UlaG (beta-lactamase superfamily)
VRIRWYGQSAFLLSGDHTVFIDPFGDMSAAAARGIEFNYPPVADVTADVLLVTHEHGDHNVVEAVGGDPVTIRSTAGRFESPIGEVVAIASEHDDVAGTVRGPNTIFRFELDGVRCCHLGDFGQRGLRPEQHDAIGEIDVLFLPVGGGPTIGGEGAADVVRMIAPRVVVPMHYRTPAINFLDPPDEFIAALGMPSRKVPSSEVEVDAIEGVVLLAPPQSA